MTDEFSVVLEKIFTPFYYGNTFEVVLPMQTERGMTKYNILLNGEPNFSPFPFVVAKYKLVDVDTDTHTYEFVGCEIKNND